MNRDLIFRGMPPCISRRIRRWGLCGALACVLALAWTSGPIGCTPEPRWRIGFVGGLTGRVADLGVAGRDGAILAVEDVNRRGGVGGRQVEMLIRDDRQDEETARRVDQELIDVGVAAIVGHMTSAMSEAGLPLMNRNRTLMMSPTTSTNELTGEDDFFFRVYPANNAVAKRLADYVAEGMETPRVSVVYDLGNRAYTESMFRAFMERLETLGGAVTTTHTFTSGPEVDFWRLAQELAGENPSGVLVLASAFDTAMLCQQFRKLAFAPFIVTGEWSATKDLVSFGGSSVEGIRFFHTVDRNSTTAAYRDFQERFAQRFGYGPDFASVHAYDATMVVLTALGDAGNSAGLREAILAHGRFEGLQTGISFDRFGDVEREYFLLTVHNGEIVQPPKR